MNDIQYTSDYHVPACFKDDNASQRKSGKFDSRSLKNPGTDRHQNLHGWLRYAKFYHHTITPFARLPPKYAKMCIKWLR